MRGANLLILTLTVVFTGCETAPPQAAAVIEAAQEREARIRAAAEEALRAAADCRARRLAGELRTYTASVRCSNPTFLSAMQQGGYPYMDLIHLLAAARLAGAEKIDRQELTEAEFQLQYTELAARVTAEEQRRNLETLNTRDSAIAARAPGSQVQAAHTRALDALLTGLSAFDAVNRSGLR